MRQGDSESLIQLAEIPVEGQEEGDYRGKNEVKMHGRARKSRKAPEL